MVVVLPRTSEQLDNFESFATWSCVPKSEYISDFLAVSKNVEKCKTKLDKIKILL